LNVRPSALLSNIQLTTEDEPLRDERPIRPPSKPHLMCN
jgi:hypothetical protein